MIKAEKGKSTVRQRENIKRHKQVESVPAKALLRKDNDCWEVKSLKEKDKIYLVRRISSTPCACFLQCSSCMACVHLFDCTCLDYAIRGVVCHHIHAVSLAGPTHEPREQEIEPSVEEKREDLANLILISKEQKNCTELEDLKRNAMSIIAELTDVIQVAPKSDNIHAALRHVRSVISVARGLTVIGTDHQYLKTKSYPANKLADKSDFFSIKTKRKIKEKSSILSQSTVQELSNIDPYVCAFCFKEEPPSSDGSTITWIECSNCKVWVHTFCDYVEDNTNYVCYMWRTP